MGNWQTIPFGSLSIQNSRRQSFQGYQKARAIIRWTAEVWWWRWWRKSSAPLGPWVKWKQSNTPLETTPGIPASAADVNAGSVLPSASPRYEQDRPETHAWLLVKTRSFITSTFGIMNTPVHIFTASICLKEVRTFDINLLNWEPFPTRVMVEFHYWIQCLSFFYFKYQKQNCEKHQVCPKSRTSVLNT